MATYQITEKLITNNRSHEPLQPQGFVIHSTATPGATDEAEDSYFNGGYRGASAHYFVDWDSITRAIPENEVAWHAGQTANHKFLSVEMSEPAGNNPAQFQEVWNRTVWLVADACVRYGWNTHDNVFSHRGISMMYKETDHTDPIQYLANYGRTWSQLLAAIDAAIVVLKTPPAPKPVPKPATKYVTIVPAKGVNMRTDAGTQFRAILAIPNAVKLAVQDSKNGWYLVSYAGHTGWILGSLTK